VVASFICTRFICPLVVSLLFHFVGGEEL